MRAAYQQWLSGVRQQLDSHQLSDEQPSLHSSMPSIPQKLHLSPRKGPTYRTNWLSGFNLFNLHITKQGRPERTSPKLDSGQGQNWRLLVFCILSPNSLHCTTCVTNFLGLVIIFRIHFKFLCLPILEGSRIWCGVVGRVRALLVTESGNQGSSPEPSVGPSFLIC